MPHLHVKEFVAAPLPATQDDIRFDFIATNILHDDEKLIATEYEGKQFFLLAKESETKTLLKSDKLTRPSPNYLVKHALLAYAKLSKSDVLASNVDVAPKSRHLENESALKDIHFFTSNFPQDRDVQIEVGFGSGRHLLHQAEHNPDILFIGIEIHKASIEQVLKQVSIKKLDNVMVLDYDARLFLEFVPSNIVSKIFVHFPVPWDKKPHRRVISKTFLDEAERVLCQDGRLELRTDSDNYFEYSYGTFISRNKISMEVHKNRDIEITSKYEDRWKRMEKNIYDITMINATLSDPLPTQADFTFQNSAIASEKLLELNGTTIRFEEGFIHFERLYSIQNGDMLYRISIGSFDRPEHLYIIMQAGKVRYFPTLPVASRANIKAHDILKATLHG
jgi:tRNA (guanine-N7-)-methyltransferase